MDNTKAPLLTRNVCPCCTDERKIRARRRAKRRERQAVARMIRLTY